MTRKRPRTNGRDWLTRLDEVRETGDRRAAPALLDLLLAPATDDDRRVEIAAALRALEDVRCAAPLVRAIFDTELPCVVRTLALEVHAAIPVDVAPRAEAVAWARSPDVVVRAFGVRTLDVADGDTLARAAGDPEPLVRYAAVDAMASIVRTRPLVEATRRALVDEDAAIREAACRVALFDEPLDATRELLRALSDTSSTVRIAACDALEDFPRICVLLALAEARGDSEDGLAADLAFESVAGRIRAALDVASPSTRRRLERWSAPVAWLLERPGRPVDQDEDAADDEGGPGRRESVNVGRAERLLGDHDTAPAEQRRLLVFCDWTKTGARGLDLLRRCAASPDWSLRQGAAFALADLDATGDLLALAADREPVVRRAALEELRSMEEPAALEPARATLADPVMRPTAGDDALALLAELAPRREAERAVLAELERPDDRDGLLLGAIHVARHLRMTSAAKPLARIVEEPVTASVLPHVAALAALRSLGGRRRADLSHLEALDHLEVQRELGEWDWHGPRYG